MHIKFSFRYIQPYICSFKFLQESTFSYLIAWTNLLFCYTS